MRIRYLVPIIVLGVAACSPSPKHATSGDQAGAGGANGYVGTITTSGLSNATWSPGPGAEADPFNSIANLTLVSDKQSYGNIHVDLNGDFSFGSADPAFKNNLSFKGGGAKVTLDKSGVYVCAFSIDQDLKGEADGSTLHVKGSMTVHWHPEGLGDISCP